MTARLTVLRADDHVRMAWANGGGTTYQVATSPEGAGLDTFDWRVSLAEVASAGPFSSLPGVDRILVLVEGDGMELVVDGRVVSIGRHDVVRFAGDADAACTLTAGPTRDLNVMTRRGRCTASLDIVTVAGSATAEPVPDATTMLVVLDGQVRADEVRLWAQDVLVLDRVVVLRGTATAARIVISPP